MATLQTRVHLSTDFTYDPTTKTFSAEASDFVERLSRGPFDRLYDDACDEGFTIHSATTHYEVTFYVDAVHRDRDGDITHWTMKPTTESIRRLESYCPHVATLRVVLFND